MRPLLSAVLGIAALLSVLGGGFIFLAFVAEDAPTAVGALVGGVVAAAVLGGLAFVVDDVGALRERLPRDAGADPRYPRP